MLKYYSDRLEYLSDLILGRSTGSPACSYGGWSASFGVGNYTMSQLEAMGVINDDASSIKVPAGLKVTIYEDNNYGGNSAVITSDQSCLTNISFNDDISSIKVSTN